MMTRTGARVDWFAMAATDEETTARELPPGLWDRLRLDPVRAPEHIALAAGRTFAPQAERWAADKRARFAVAPAELAKLAKKRHATLARFEGAATGVGGIVTIVPDLVALADAVTWLRNAGSLAGEPLTGSVAAVSVGIVAGEPMLDLCYEEDVVADTDMNVVMTGDGAYVEVQGTAEAAPFDRKLLDAMLDLAATGCAELTEIQRRALET